MKLTNKIEYALVLVNVLACLPFLSNWWMAPPQLLWAAYKLVRLALGSNVITEKDAYKKEKYLKHRTTHTMSLFFYLMTWFIYFARAVTAVMDIHVHGISPYD